MGSFYVNFAVRGRGAAAVAESLRRARREALVGPSVDGVTYFFDRAADRQSEEEIVRAGTSVSSDLGCGVLAVLNHDDDVLAYWLFAAGQLVDEYNSCPGYFTGGETAPSGGNAVQLCTAFEVPGQIAAVEKILHHSSYAFAQERHADLAKALGLPGQYAETSYRRVLGSLEDERLARSEGIDPKEFIRVDVEHAASDDEDPDTPLVTLRELERETEHLAFFNWIGADKQFHYFATREGKRYRVERAVWEMPAHMAALMPRPGDGVALFVTIKDGKIAIPDPRTMTDSFDNEL